MKKKINARCRLILTVMLFSLTGIHVSAQGKSPYVQGGSYPVMHVVEVSFTSQATYNSNFSAYLDVDVWVDLTGPGGAYRIPVFWNGGNEFRARLVATSTGTWDWDIDAGTVTNNDQGFLEGTIGKGGSFVATAAGDVNGNANNHGFIRVADNDRTLEYADGTPFFYTADTSWTLLTGVFDFDTQANGVSGVPFTDYIVRRKAQGFNGMNVIASFPDDTYLQNLGRNLSRPGTETGLWSNPTWGKKIHFSIAPSGETIEETPFELKGPGEQVTDAHPEADYTKINPTYWQAVDVRMQFLADQGFVTLFQTVRRHERWPFRTQIEKDAFYNYVRYLWARYGCYNMIFSWVHHDISAGVYHDWRSLVISANNTLKTKINDFKMPYGQPRTAMSFGTSKDNWERDIPTALDIQNVSNAERNSAMHGWLMDIFYNSSVKPALNLEPYYPGWRSNYSIHPKPDADFGDEERARMAQAQMYGSVLGGGFAGHSWGDTWYSGAAHSSDTNSVPRNAPLVSSFPQPFDNSLQNLEGDRFSPAVMRHLREFITDDGHEYGKLRPAAGNQYKRYRFHSNRDEQTITIPGVGQTHLANSYFLEHALAIDSNREFALGFYAAPNGALIPTAPTPPNIINLKEDTVYRLEWWDVTNGGWDANTTHDIRTNGQGVLVPNTQNLDLTKNWAYRIRTLGYINGGGNSNFALRINTGGGVITSDGHSYVADSHFDTGKTLARPQTGLPEPYRSFRYSTSEVMGYDIPLANGDYTVRLHFAELWFGATDGGTGGAGSRIFDVSLEDRLAEDDLDVFAEVGAEAMLVKTHTVTVADGELNIDFDSRDVVGGERHPIINAIEILEIEDGDLPIANAGSDRTITLPTNAIQLNGSGSDPDGGMVTYSWSQDSGPSTAVISGGSTATPTVSNLLEGSYVFELTVTDDESDTTSDAVTVTVDPEPPTGDFTLRINTGGGATTYDGDNYAADTHFDTGRTLARPGTGLPEPYRSFRYSTSEVMGYDIPLANGDYTVRLHFAELWFGATDGGSGGVGKRVFDVSLEGRLAEDDLDVFAEVGAEVILVKTHKVTVTDGELNIDFDSRDVVGGERHPIINAIEILEIEGGEPVNGLVGHWPLNEQTGTIAGDVSGQGNNGDLQPRPSFTFDSYGTDGQLGGALEFDGRDDHIELPDIDNGMQSGFTVSAWVKPSNAAGGYQGVAGSSTSGGFMMFIGQNKLWFKVSTNENGNKLTSAGNIQNDVWQMVTCTFDGSHMRWYVDGAIQHTEAYSGTLTDQNVGYIGYSGWANGNEYFQGGIDDVRMYDEALSEGQIASLFDEGNVNTTQVNLATPANLSSVGTENWQDPPYPLSNIHDGDIVSRAHSNDTFAPGAEVFVQYDLATPHTITSARLIEDDGGNHEIDSWKIQWFDGTTWQDAFAFVPSDTSAWQEEDFTDISNVSSIRLVVMVPDTRDPRAEVQQLEIWGYESSTTSLKASLMIKNVRVAAYVYPNVTTGKFRISGLSPGAKEIGVADFSGRMLITLKTDREEPELDLATYPDGIYFVKVLQNGSKQTFKVVKE